MNRYIKFNLLFISLFGSALCVSAQSPLTVNGAITISSANTYTTITINNASVLTITGNISVSATQLTLQGGKLILQNGAKLTSSGSINFNQPTTAIKGGIELSGPGTKLVALDANFGSFSVAQASYISVSTNAEFNLTGNLNMNGNSLLTLIGNAQTVVNNGGLNMGIGSKVSVTTSSFSIRDINQSATNTEISLSQSNFTVLANSNIQGVLKLEFNSSFSQVGEMNINSSGIVNCLSGSSLNLQSNLNNGAGLSAYPNGSQPYFIFSSSLNQAINGDNKFYKVKLSGATSQKKFFSANEVTFSLDLGNSELSTPYNTFYLSNPDPNSLLRTTG